jgi:hypothetical protein
MNGYKFKLGVRSLTLAAVMAGLSLPGAFAQFSSGIEGSVRDQNGGVLVGAKVSVTDTQLGVTKTTTTNQEGYFRIDSIPASNYTVEVQIAGFKTWNQSDLLVQAGETRTIAPVLEVGAVSASVSVTAGQAAVNLTSPTTGTVISQETVQQTPLPGQNVYGLSALTPGITGSAVTTGDNYTNEYAININAAGLRQEQNGYQIDGAYTNTPSRGGGTSISPNPEVVQSMDIRTNDFDASKGRNGGATVDVFTKSGTNDFHGTVDYYFTNASLTALTHFESTVPSFARNEVGATFGGPILKNRLFIYGAIDVLRSSVTSANQYTFETQDFANYVKANLSNTVAATVLAAAPPLVYPTSGLLTVAQVEAQNPGYFAPPPGIPASLNAVGIANISYSIPKNGYQWSVRGDYYLGQNDRFYVTSLRTYDTSTGATPRAALNIPQANSSDFISTDWTHTFSPRLLNEGGINLIRPYGADLPVPTAAIPYINVTGLQGFSNWGPGNFTQSTLGWRDVMTATVKNHTLKFGFEQFNIREADAQDGAFDRPTYNFNNILDFVQDEATSETGTPVDLNTHLEAPYQRRYRALYSGLFVQDDWKLTSKFTLNAGLRYDSMANFFSIYTPKLTRFTFSPTGTLSDQIANGAAGLANTNHVLDHSIWGLNPRLGFAWDVFGAGKTAVRGGFGLFADQPPYLHITDITAGNLPNYFHPNLNVQSGTQPVFQLCSPPSGFTTACPVVDTSNVTINQNGGLVNNGVLQRATLGGLTPQYKLTQVLDWTLSVQQELPSNLVAEVNYSASAAHHLPIYQDINRFDGDLIANNGSLTRLNQNFADIQYGTSNGNSIGNFGSAQLMRRMNRGLALRGIYTFGKTLDVYSNAQSLDSGSITAVTNVIESQNLKAQRGRADFDIRQQFSFDGTWIVPNNYSSALERAALGGWQFGGVWILQSGLPFTVYTSASFAGVYDTAGTLIANKGGDYNGDGYNYDIPNTPSFGKTLSGKGKKDYLNGLFVASDFPTPNLGEQGSLGRNTYSGPGYNNVDFTFEKIFSVPWFFTERMKIEARGEVFNLFNRSNLTAVASDLSNGSFGRATNQLPPRSLQFHLRASF